MAVLYVVWALINLAFAVGLAFCWYRCFQLFAQRYNRAASIALCVVTLATCSSGRKQGPVQPSTHISTTLDPAFAADRPVMFRKRLLDLPLTQLTQAIYLNPPSQPGDSARIEHSVLLSGLEMGLRWEPVFLQVSPRPDRQLHYYIVGTLNWQLLNMTIYKQPLQYTGTVDPATQPSR